MHVPSGLVSEQINAATAIVSAGVLTYALLRVKRSFSEKPTEVLKVAVVSALLFAAQMLNFSIGGGTSGHLVGGVLAASLLGPWAACLSLTAVLGVQAFFFADGGISALGTNILNMGIVGCVVAYPLMQAFRRVLPAGKAGEGAAVALASWASIVMASAACAIELAASGTSSFGVVVPAMVGTHALIGIGEAALTLLALAAFAGLSSRREQTLAFGGLALAVVLAAVSGPLASTAPDGLEKVALDNGFAVATEQPALLSGDFAGVIGTLLVFAMVLALSRTAVRSAK